jgi:hypothetical protein
MSKRGTVAVLAGVGAWMLSCAAVLAGFAGTDVFLPMAGRQAGVHPSNWYTTVWIHNPGPAAAAATVWFLERNTANPTPPGVGVLVAPGETEMIENAVEALFHVQAFGALRITCPDQRLIVTSRVYSKAAGASERDSVGQDFAGVPASFAIGLGQRTAILGVHQTDPASSDYRSNFGFVETTGRSATVRVTVYDGENAFLAAKDFQIREFSQRQVAFKDHFPGVALENARLEIEVISGSGRVIAYGSAIANGSQDPTTLEMQYAEGLLSGSAITAVYAGGGLTGGGSAGEVTLHVGAGPGIAVDTDSVAIAPQGVATEMLQYRSVTPDRIAASPVVGQVLTTVPPPPSPAADGAFAITANQVAWQDPPGLALPWSGSTAAPATAFAVESTGGGAIRGQSSNGFGVVGRAGTNPLIMHVMPIGVLGESGNGVGVKGASSSASGVYGTSTSGPGVAGSAESGSGVYGRSTNGVGVQGTTDRPDWIGVEGQALAGPQARGVFGMSFEGQGVYGTTSEGTGVYGFSTHGVGVWGQHSLGSYGQLGADTVGVYGHSPSGHGVVAESNAVGLGGAALYAHATAGKGIGVFAETSSTDATIVATNTGTGDLLKLFAAAGELRLRVNNLGAVAADGGYATPASDLSDLVPATGVGAGDVVAIAADGSLALAATPFQRNVAGVVATRPGFVGGYRGDGDSASAPLALAGIVPVKACDEGGPIAPGDLLAASSTPGHAMRAGDDPPAGSVIGKALGALAGGCGLVEMLVMLR